MAKEKVLGVKKFYFTSSLFEVNKVALSPPPMYNLDQSSKYANVLFYKIYL